MPNKTWAVGEEVLAPDFNTYVQQQVIAQFPTAAARNAGIAAPVGGQASYVDTGDANEGPEFWNGVAWRKPWNMPWGVVGHSTITVDQNGVVATLADLTGFTATFTAVANRQYRVDFVAHIYSSHTVAGLAPVIKLNDGATFIGNVWIAGAMALNETRLASAYRILNLAAGAHTLKLMAQTNSGWIMNIVNSATNGQFTVTDVGSALGALAPT